jgi:hypothetical protein
MRRIGHIDNRGAVVFGLSSDPVDRFGHVGRSTVMSDIGDVAVALMMDRRLIGAAGLQIVVTDQPHVFGFRRIAELRRLGERGYAHQRHHCGRCARRDTTAAPDRDGSLHRRFSLLVPWPRRCRRRLKRIPIEPRRDAPLAHA